MGQAEGFDPALLEHLIHAQAAEQGADWAGAAHHYNAAVQAAPQDHRLHCNLGNVLWLADLPMAARDAFCRAVELAPEAALPWRGLGNSERDSLHFGQAAQAYRRSLALADEPLTAWNLSQVLLGLERYREAFAVAEQRLTIPELEPYQPCTGWDGLPSTLHQAQAAGVPLQIWSEQGFGDTLQFLRWLVPLDALLESGGPAPQLVVEPALAALLQQGLSWLSKPPQVVAKGQEPPRPAAWQPHHIALQSLPARLGGGQWADPRQCGDGPWLRLDPNQARTTGRVGVLWAAGRKLDDGFTRREYGKRSLPARSLGTLMEGLAASGASLVALQHGDDRELVASWRPLLAHELPAQADFLATAQLLQSLDLVITVDTAMAHLAGCLGRPTWVLLPWSADPRWLRQRSDSPWYPSLRLFRQPASGDWGGAVEALLTAFRTDIRTPT
jgi:hypothetical protein